MSLDGEVDSIQCSGKPISPLSTGKCTHSFLAVSSFQPLPSVLHLKNPHLEIFLGPQWASKIAMYLALPLELSDYTRESPYLLHWRWDVLYVHLFFSVTVGCSTSALARPCVLTAVTNRNFTIFRVCLALAWK